MSFTLHRSALSSRLLGICLALALSSGAYAAGIACDDPNNCQLPDIKNFPGGIILTSVVTQDNFVPTTSGNITAACWWGAYIDQSGVPVDCGPGPGDNFTITYYTNVPGCPLGVPTTVIGSFSVVATKAPTGMVFDLGGFPDPVAEYGFSASHPAVPVDAGMCYWIEIINDTGPGDCVFFWEVSPLGPGDGSVSDGSPVEYDMAWCIDLALDPDISVCTPITIPQCEMATGECLFANDTPGCDDPCCCTLVCQTDPFCCFDPWDQGCADTAIVLCLGACDTCGLPNCGDCFEDNGSAYCDDQCLGKDCAGCCLIVCGLDPYCCDTDWDGFCVDEALEFCTCEPEQVPENDNCENATIVGDGAHVFTTVCATNDGPYHADGPCDDGFTTIGADVWFHITASSSGVVTIDTCGQADFDTKIAVYDGCTCPVTKEMLIECNDIGAGCGPKDNGAEVIFNAVGGNCYLVRVGGGYLDPAGSGTITIDGVGDPPPPCPWDLDGGGDVGIGDLLILLAEWGNPYGIPDLLAMLAAWGACP